MSTFMSVAALKNVLFPTDGFPTMPIFTAMCLCVEFFVLLKVLQ